MAKEETKTVTTAQTAGTNLESGDAAGVLAEVNPERQGTSVVLVDGDSVVTYHKGEKYDVKKSLLNEKDPFGLAYLTEVKK